MENSILICPACGKQNPENARFCYDCGALLTGEDQNVSGPSQPAEGSIPPAPSETPQAPYAQTQPKYVPPASQVAPSPAYPPAYPQQAFPPVKRSRRGRVRCCAIGCLVVLLVLLIGLPILHVTVLRPIIERAIYKQVEKNVAEGEGQYYGADTETITERMLNEDAQDAWSNIPGSSDNYLSLQQDQIKLETKIYGVKVWATADIRVNNDGYFLVKSLKMNWLLHILFSDKALKREIAKIANEKFIQPKGLFVLAFQVTDRQIFIAYERR